MWVMAEDACPGTSRAVNPLALHRLYDATVAFEAELIRPDLQPVRSLRIMAEGAAPLFVRGMEIDRGLGLASNRRWGRSGWGWGRLFNLDRYRGTTPLQGRDVIK